MENENVTGELVTGEIEETNQARFRKLGLCVLALLAVHATQIRAGQPVTWEVVGIDAVIVLGFVSADTLDKAFQSGALGKLKEKVAGLVSK